MRIWLERLLGVVFEAFAVADDGVFGETDALVEGDGFGVVVTDLEVDLSRTPADAAAVRLRSSAPMPNPVACDRDRRPGS
jgi:hypothetical protein